MKLGSRSVWKLTVKGRTHGRPKKTKKTVAKMNYSRLSFSSGKLRRRRVLFAPVQEGSQCVTWRSLRGCRTGCVSPGREWNLPVKEATLRLGGGGRQFMLVRQMRSGDRRRAVNGFPDPERMTETAMKSIKLKYAPLRVVVRKGSAAARGLTKAAGLDPDALAPGLEKSPKQDLQFHILRHCHFHSRKLF